jgi:glycerol-3-phosphate dehydrogenase (NAD(P)+)
MQTQQSHSTTQLSSHKGPVSVFGAGSWGTALATLLSRTGAEATLWCRNPTHAATMRNQRMNQRYLPGITLPDSLTITDDLAQALDAARDLLVVVPSHSFRKFIQSMLPYMNPEHRLAWATKGFESDTGKLLHEVVAEEVGFGVCTAVVSGPTFALEVAKGLPTAVTVASASDSFASELAERLHDDTFRAYTSSDIIGVEVGGCVKNVLAIAAGIADGLGLGANTRAALITRGLVEVMRLGQALGGRSETFMGLAGLGDLVLTCTDDLSRNRRLGLALGRGASLKQALESIDQVVEGIQAAKEVCAVAAAANVEMPIIEQVYQVLYQSKQPREAVHDLLARELKSETIV